MGSKKWSRREDEVMSELGLKPTKQSGAGWLEKEDGEGEEIIVQLKSTEGKGIAVRREDVKALFYHAAISHKTPVFVIDIMPSYQLVAFRPENYKEIYEWLKGVFEGEN